MYAHGFSIQRWVIASPALRQYIIDLAPLLMRALPMHRYVHYCDNETIQGVEFKVGGGACSARPEGVPAWLAAVCGACRSAWGMPQAMWHARC